MSKQGKKVEPWKVEAIKFFASKYSKGKVSRELEVSKNTVTKYAK